MKKVKVAIFISDVGFGHMVRQREIITQLLKKIRNIDITVVNFSHIEILKETFGKKISYKKYYNNITLYKDKNSFFNLKKSQQHINKWPKSFYKTEKFIKKNFINFDFFISDFVPEVFEIGKKMKIPSFGVCHYTWSWYFSQIKGNTPRVIKLLKNYELNATRNYFLPFTPKGVFLNYKKKKIYKKVGFVINKVKIPKIKKSKKTFLIMDNGTKSLAKLIDELVPKLSDQIMFNFYIGISSLNNRSKKIISESRNLFPVIGLKGIYSYIKKVDHVIVRGGFNSITECLLFKKPSIFMSEKFNPEVEANLQIIKNKKLGSIMNHTDWNNEFFTKLKLFIKNDSKIIKKNLDRLKISHNGAIEIVQDIKNVLKFN